MVTVATIGKSVGAAGGQQRARDGSLYPLTIATPREAYLYLAAGPALPHADGELLSAPFSLMDLLAISSLMSAYSRKNYDK